MHEKRGQEWVQITPTSAQLAHVYKVPDRSFPGIPERSLRAILDRPAEPVANAPPFLTVDPASSSAPPPAPMSASQSQEGSHIWPVGNMTLQFDIPERGWSSPSTGHIPPHSQQQNLQERFLELTQQVDGMQQHVLQLQQERFLELTQKVDGMQQHKLQLQERIATLESGRHAVEELQQSIVQLQERNTMLEGERIETLESRQRAVEELRQSIAQLQERNTMLEGERRQVEAVEGDGVDGFEYVADGANNPPANVAAQ